jgi:hypothetical protein
MHEKNSDMMFEERSKHRVRRIKPTIISWNSVTNQFYCRHALVN